MTLNERPVEPFPERNHRLQPFNVECVKTYYLLSVCPSIQSTATMI